MKTIYRILWQSIVIVAICTLRSGPCFHKVGISNCKRKRPEDDLNKYVNNFYLYLKIMIDVLIKIEL